MRAKTAMKDKQYLTRENENMKVELAIQVMIFSCKARARENTGQREKPSVEEGTRQLCCGPEPAASSQSSVSSLSLLFHFTTFLAVPHLSAFSL